MASGSSSRGRRSGARGSSSRARAAQAPSADDALLGPQLNPTFVAMPAADLLAYLNQHRRTDNFVDAALVFASRERRLAEAEERIDSLLHEIRARDHSALEAEDKIRRAAETEAALRAKIRTLQLGAAALISSGISGGGGGGLAQQAAAAGHGREEPVPQDFITASDDRVGFDDATGVQTTVVHQGEVGDDVPMKMRHGALNRAAPHHLAAAPVPSAAAALISSGISGRGLTQEAAGLGREPVPQDFITATDDGVGSDDATGVQTMFAQRKVGNDVPMKMMHGALSRAAPHLAAAMLPRAPPHLAAAAPLPDTLIDDDKRAAEQVAANIASKYEVAQGDHKVSEDVLRASTTAPAVPDRPDESPEAEDGGSNRAASEAGPRLKRKRQARPNKRFAGPEWDV